MIAREELGQFLGRPAAISDLLINVAASRHEVISNGKAYTVLRQRRRR
jgi:hypothetical protein